MGKFGDSFNIGGEVRKEYDVYLKKKKLEIVISLAFSRDRAPIHWLVHGHTTFN